MLYVLFAAPTFFLRPLADPVVTWMLRGLFDTYFPAVSSLSALGAVAFAGAGRPGVAFGLGALTAAALAARAWFLRRMDADLRARDGGDPTAVWRLRRLHLGGLACNAVQFATIIACIPWVFPVLA